jgi:hypothetical protein
MMSPQNSKRVDGKEIWKQEIWVMIQKGNSQRRKKILSSGPIKVISAWRYPGVSPKNSPIPEEIIRELELVL